MLTQQSSIKVLGGGRRRNRTERPQLQSTEANAKSPYDFSKLWIGPKMKVSEVSTFMLELSLLGCLQWGPKGITSHCLCQRGRGRKFSDIPKYY